MTYKYIFPIQEKHLRWIMATRNRPEIMMWFRQTNTLTMDDQNVWFNRIDKSTHFAIYSGVYLVGYCGLYVDKRHDTAEFGIFTWGTNVGKYALKELLDYGFNELKLRVIHSDVFSVNPARKLYKLMGFTEEGEYQARYTKAGVEINSVPFSMHKGVYATSHCRLR